MFAEELSHLMEELEVSQGEVLQMAREISCNDNLRTVDRLTSGERNELILALQALRLRYCATV